MATGDLSGLRKKATLGPDFQRFPDRRRTDGETEEHLARQSVVRSNLFFDRTYLDGDQVRAHDKELLAPLTRGVAWMRRRTTERVPREADDEVGSEES